MRIHLVGILVYSGVAFFAGWLALTLRQDMKEPLLFFVMLGVAMALINVVNAVKHGSRWWEILRLLDNGRVEAFLRELARVERHGVSSRGRRVVAVHRATALIYAGRFDAAQHLMLQTDDRRLPVEARMAQHYNRVLFAILTGQRAEAEMLFQTRRFPVTPIVRMLPFFRYRLRLLGGLLSSHGESHNKVVELEGIADSEFAGAALRALANAELGGLQKGEKARARLLSAQALGSEMEVSVRSRLILERKA